MASPLPLEPLQHQMSAESNYQLLLQLAGALGRPKAYEDEGAVIKGRVSDIRVKVVSRDPRGRPGRVGFVTDMATRVAAATPTSVAIEVQLYHEHQLAVPLAFQENTSFRSAYDREGRVLASRLAELTGLLYRWLLGQLREPD